MPVVEEAKQFTSARPWCSNAGPAIRLQIIRRRETIQPRTIKEPREITQLRVTRLRVALPLRPSTVVVEAVGIAVEAAAVETAVAAVVAVPDPMAAVVAVIAAAEATVKV